MSTVKPTALPPFQMVFDEHAQAVLTFLAGAVGASEAEDCFQETMLSALRAYPRMQDASNLRGWLFTIARRKAIDAHRARARRPAQWRIPIPDRQSMSTTRSMRACGTTFAACRSSSARPWSSASPETKAIPRSPQAMSTTQDLARQSVHEGLKKLRRELQ